MEQMIREFSFENEDITTLDENGLVWFASKDLSKYTGHKDIKSAVRNLDDDEVQVIQLLDKTGRKNHIQMISESGFYKVMFRSQLPQAKALTKFVTSVILPTIRKTGSYNANTKHLQELANDKQEVKELTDRKSLINKRIRFLKLRIEDNENKVYNSCRTDYKVPEQENSTQMTLFN